MRFLDKLVLKIILIFSVILIVGAILYAVGSSASANTPIVIPSKNENKETYYEVKPASYYQSLQKAKDGETPDITSNPVPGQFSATQQQVMSALKSILGNTYSKAWMKSITHASGNPLNWFYQVYPAAIVNYIEDGIFPSVQMAQTGFETGWGVASPAWVNGYNCAGMEAPTGTNPASLWPGATGFTGSAGGDMSYVKFPTATAGFLAYGQNLKKGIYAKVKTDKTPQEQITAIADAGYCASIDYNGTTYTGHSAYGHYAEQIIQFINQYHLEALDNIANKVKDTLGSAPGGGGGPLNSNDYPGWDVSSLQSFLSQVGVTYSSLSPARQKLLSAAWALNGHPYYWGGGHSSHSGTPIDNSSIQSVYSQSSGQANTNYHNGCIENFNGSEAQGSSSHPIGGAMPISKGKTGFDCSGYVDAALSNAGLFNTLGATGSIADACQEISNSKAQPGDLVEVDDRNHVAIFISYYKGKVVVLQAEHAGVLSGPGYLFDQSGQQTFLPPGL